MSGSSFLRKGKRPSIPVNNLTSEGLFGNKLSASASSSQIPGYSSKTGFIAGDKYESYMNEYAKKKIALKEKNEQLKKNVTGLYSCLSQVRFFSLRFWWHNSWGLVQVAP